VPIELGVRKKQIDYQPSRQISNFPTCSRSANPCSRPPRQRPGLLEDREPQGPRLHIDWKTCFARINPFRASHTFPITNHQNEAELKGLNRRNLFRMSEFYETHADNPIVSTLWTQFNEEP